MLTILFYCACFFFFLIIEFFYRYFLIAGVIVQIFNLTAKLAIPIETPTKEAKAEIEIHPVIVAPKKKKSSIYFRIVKKILCFSLINPFRFISSNK